MKKHPYTRVIIAGSRSFNDYEILMDRCSIILKHFDTIEIVSGGAKGADALAIAYAKSNNYECKIVAPDWKRFGKAAGFVRNAAMVEYADVLIAFRDSESLGTLHVIDLAKRFGGICVWG